MSRVVEVQVEQDHLAKLIRPSQPVAALAELIWNSLDAEATEVSATLIENPLGGIDEVRVQDNGQGMTVDQAAEAFGTLGGSWKRAAVRSHSQQRLLHGSEGQGRWRSYALGNRVRWISVSEAGERRQQVVVEGDRAGLGRFTISDPEETESPIGTLVIVDHVVAIPKGLTGELIVEELTAIFAGYLEQYSVRIIFKGIPLDPQQVQAHREEIDLSVEGLDPPEARLTIIEWDRPFPRAIYLCDQEGATLEEIPPRIQAPGFDFTAYIKWSGFRNMISELVVADLDPTISLLVEDARSKLKDHFRSRAAHLSRSIVEDWKAEEVYPFSDEPKTVVESAKRELFDVVALVAAPTVNKSDDRISKKLILGLIKEALEENPGSLHRIMSQVLELPEDKLSELDSLLRRTPLTAIITAAKRIADRLDFLKSLEALLFETESTKTLLERAQLHRILASETWIFGEEFNLLADDDSLTRVLEAHVKELGRDNLTPEPVLDDQGRPRIVDLVLCRALRLNKNRREHLVVELKRPSVTLGSEEATQIERYAYAVAADNRFNKTDVDWNFFLVGNSWDEFVEKRAQQKDKPPGLISDSEGIRVWVKTWGQLMTECDHRLKFVQSSLDYIPSQEEALEYLRKTHSKYLPESVEALAAKMTQKSQSPPI